MNVQDRTREEANKEERQIHGEGNAGAQQRELMDNSTHAAKRRQREAWMKEVEYEGRAAMPARPPCRPHLHLRQQTCHRALSALL
jgi:hypothetical protein